MLIVVIGSKGFLGSNIIETLGKKNNLRFLEIFRKDGQEIDFKFCGRGTQEGIVYCQSHYKQAYQPLSKVRERRKAKKKFRITN